MEQPQVGTTAASRPLVLRALLRTIPHLALVVIFFIYLILGAIMFMEIEGDKSDVKTLEKDREELREMMEESHNCSGPPSCEPPPQPSGGRGDRPEPPEPREPPEPPKCKSPGDVYDHMLMSFEDKKEWKVGRIQNIQANRSWEFYSSMLFCATTITTVGYGEVVPVTQAGRMACIAYALIGIPLTLLLLADIGNCLGKVILLICKLIRPSMVVTRIRRDSFCTCCFPSRLNQEEDPWPHESQNGGSRGDSLAVNGDGLAAQSQTSLNSVKLQTLSGTNSLNNQIHETRFNRPQQYDQSLNPGSSPPSYNQSMSEQSHSPGIREHIYNQSSDGDSNFPHEGYKTQFSHASTYKDSNPSISKHQHHSLKEIMEKTCDEVVEEVPLWIVGLIFFAYTTLGAYGIKVAEGWPYDEALYFTIITLTTIGFGDYIPVKLYEKGEFLSCLAFTMFGMAVTSMCITLAQSKVVRFCNKMAIKFGF